MSMVEVHPKTRWERLGVRHGYLAIFEDGDCRKHESMIKKTHCVRTRLATWRRWQNHWGQGIVGQTSAGTRWLEIRGDYGLLEFSHHKYYYEFFIAEDAAIVRASKYLAEMVAYKGQLRDQDQPDWFYDQPKYQSVDLVPVRHVYTLGEAKVDALISDPRFSLHSGRFEDLHSLGGMKFSPALVDTSHIFEGDYA